MSIWDENCPDLLFDISTRFCVQNLQTFCDFEPRSKRYYLREGIILPTEICERMLASRKQISRTIDDDFLQIFKDPRTTRLRRVDLSKTSVTDQGLAAVLRHNLTELDISDCDKLTEESLTLINEFGSDLLSLNIGTSVHILPDHGITDAIMLLAEMRVDSHTSSINMNSACILKTPKLRKLILREMPVSKQHGYSSVLLAPFRHLESLDVSGCLNLGSLSFLSHMTQLASLTLYNVPRVNNMINAICKLKTLHHLDISNHFKKRIAYRNPNQVLSKIVDSLPHLVSLDISGTDLAGTGISEHDHTDIDIPGLRSRVNNPLDFLGLYGTSHNACNRLDIPAKRITGDANEEQTLTAAHAYLERADILENVFYNLLKIVSFETCYNAKAALEVIVFGMEKHLRVELIQIYGITSLAYILNGEEKEDFNIKNKHKLIKVVLDAMCEHRLDRRNIWHNGCLILNKFQIPEDVLFDYERLVRILLPAVSQDNQDDFVQHFGVSFLNSLACHLDGTPNQLVGDLGAINSMLRLIECRLQRQLCDDVMERAWSIMWNVSVRTPVNCLRFLDGRGMTFFLECLHMFPNNAQLLYLMLGLLGNVAEVQELRPRFMTEELIKVFSELLDSTIGGIEVNYIAAAVLSHIASDGKESWTIMNPKREDVLQRMVDAIERWDMKTEQRLNYKSIEPLLQLLYVEHTTQAQYWAVWALANFTCAYPKKYCPLIQREKGLEILSELINRGIIRGKVKELALLVISHCESFKNGNGIVAMAE